MNINYQITPKQRNDIRNALISAKVSLEYAYRNKELAHMRNLINENIQQIEVAIEAIQLKTLWENQGGFDIKIQAERRVIEREIYENEYAASL